MPLFTLHVFRPTNLDVQKCLKCEILPVSKVLRTFDTPMQMIVFQDLITLKKKKKMNNNNQ
jgi:hypothetical protein